MPVTDALCFLCWPADNIAVLVSISAEAGVHEQFANFGISGVLVFFK